MRFRTKLVLWISVVLALSLGISGTALIVSSFESALQAEEENARENQKNLHQMLGLLTLANESDSVDLHESLDKLMQDQRQPICFRIDQKVLYEHQASLLPSNLSVAKPGTCSVMVLEDVHGPALLVQSAMEHHGNLYDIQLRQDLTEIYRNRDSQVAFFIRIYLAVLGIGILGALVISRLLTKPLRMLQQTVRQISDGNLSIRTGIHSRDEFESLSRDFDSMADHLQSNIEDLEKQMEQQRSFMGAFSHELKTPMTAMIGYADLLRQDSLSAGDRMQAADYIFSEGKRLERLSHKLLQLLLVQNEPLQLRQTALSTLVNEVQESIRPKLDLVQLSVAVEDAVVWVEPDLTKSLLLNLLDNAIKAVRSDGTIVLTAKPVPSGCVFSIADNGRGMEQAELERITEPFYRVDKSRSRLQGGVGLGLALCREIVHLHRGQLRFESAPGVGTRVTVTLFGEGGIS